MRGASSGPTVGVGRSYGTFGELLQGELPNGRRFLVTLPLARYATAHFTPGTTEEVHLFPRHKAKARQIIQVLMRHFGIKRGGVLFLESELPEGKGLGSSSADMVASAIAFLKAWALSISPHRLAALMASIEPTDGLMFPGVVSFYHQQGRLRQFLAPLPVLTMIAVDEGGTVDTVAFNRERHRYTPRAKRTYAQLLRKMERAVREGDLDAIGQYATESAIMNQAVLPKANLDWFLDLQKRHQALGVVVAHSGTYIGLLMNPGNPDDARRIPGLVAELSQRVPAVRLHLTHPFAPVPVERSE